MSEREGVQTYDNHVRKVPMLYWATCLAILFAALGLAWTAFRHPSVATLSMLLLALGAAGAAWYARINPLLAQDRTIRLEEWVRYDRVLPAELRARIAELSFDQIASLRFASDAELAALMRQVLDEKLHDRRTIKKLVRDWRADWMRV